jgi:uncharacterized Tic20 family protein
MKEQEVKKKIIKRKKKNILLFTMSIRFVVVRHIAFIIFLMLCLPLATSPVAHRLSKKNRNCDCVKK